MNKVILGDCLELMKEIPSNYIDMILCDLPYGITYNKEDKIIPLEPLWTQYKRIIKDNGAIVLTATQKFAAKLIASNPEMFRYDLIWIKNKATGFLNSNKMPLRQHELILIFYKNQPTYNPQKSQGHKPVNKFTKHSSDGVNYGKTISTSGGGQTDRFPTSILKFPVVNNDSKEKLHPTQKPVQLFEYLIKTYTNEGDLVLDNCIGSGTTAIACINTNRNFIGMELNIDYYNKTIKRLNNNNK